MPNSKTKPETKLFILDTNVILYDYTCIYNFKEHDVVIPIVVLEEIDQFKKGSDLINFQAREFIREMDKLSKAQLFNKGLQLKKGHGRLFVEVGEAHSELVYNAFTTNKPDHRILALADQLRHKRTDREVIIISKDINLRMKAKSLGIPAEDYETGKIRNVDELYTGIQTHENFNTEVIRRFYEQTEAVPADDLKLPRKPVANEYYILKNHSSSVLTHYNPSAQGLERIEKKRAYGIEPRNAEQVFALDALMRPEVAVVTLTGKAGTGKTLLALAAALQQRQLYSQIYLARPVVPLSNRDIGYLPGDVHEKLDPYMQPLWDNLAVIKNKFSQESTEVTRIAEMLEREKLVIAPLAYIRGRSLDKIFFIVDEAQNLTPHEIKTIITRAGEGAKMVFVGDIYQIDSPYLDTQSNGLAYLVDRMKGQDLFAHVNLLKGERSALAELASNLL
ncbi:PhoH family protein [bacterium]|nr:PhoH family protein [bacterium]NUN44175.1 PhoH family protein [bacterium]HMW33097.1 PhoH family protein [bacterium]HMW37059.1 PhoH family protein [bacterium]HMZ05545.1 PhoH family protein [bacterium]